VGEVAERLSELEERLHRTVAAGWRVAGGERVYFEDAAVQLRDLGLVALAERIRAVADAASPAEALAAIALASASVRMLQTHLPADEPSADWEIAARTTSKQALEHLLPLARMEVAGREVWACATVRGPNATGWVLIEPPLALDSAPRAKEESGGILRVLRRGSEKRDPGSQVWLRQQLEGQTRWLSRLPLGAEGDVQVCAVRDAVWRETESDPTSGARQALARGQVVDGMPVVGYSSSIQLRELSAAAAQTYTWCDPSAARILPSRKGQSAWGIAWVQKGLIVPLALVLPGGMLHPPQIVHLLDGGVAQPLAG
jgi:hypothetical protein